MKLNIAAVLVCLLAAGLAGCSSGGQADETPDTTPAQTDDVVEAGTGLSDLAALLGMADEDTAGLFGGGEENWTADGSYYIGRNYETEMYGEPVTVHTSCGDGGTVESVSVWISDGTEPLGEDAVQTWLDRVGEYTGTEAEDRGVAEESGSRSWQWRADDTLFTMYLLDDILSLSIQPAVGELK